MSDAKQNPCEHCEYEKNGACDSGNLCARYAAFFSDQWERTVALFKPRPGKKRQFYQYPHPDEVRAKR